MVSLPTSWQKDYEQQESFRMKLREQFSAIHGVFFETLSFSDIANDIITVYRTKERWPCALCVETITFWNPWVWLCWSTNKANTWQSVDIHYRIHPKDLIHYPNLLQEKSDRSDKFSKDLKAVISENSFRSQMSQKQENVILGKRGRSGMSVK